MNPDGTKRAHFLNESGLTPTADKILVEPMKVAETTHGGIILANSALDKEQLAQTIGTVLAMGGTARLCPEMEGIEVGDVVLFARYSGAEFPIDGVAYRIMRARDVIGKATRIPDSVIRGAQSALSVYPPNNALAAD